jgi:hypothetical protein
MSENIFQKSRLEAIKVDRNKFYTEDPQIWDATIHNWGDRGCTVVKVLCYKSEGS